MIEEAILGAASVDNVRRFAAIWGVHERIHFKYFMSLINYCTIHKSSLEILLLFMVIFTADHSSVALCHCRLCSFGLV